MTIRRNPLRAFRPNFDGMYMPLPIVVGDTVLTVSVSAAQAGPSPTMLDITVLRASPGAADFIAATFTGVIADPTFATYTIPIAAPTKLALNESVTLFVNGLDVAFGNVGVDYNCASCIAY